MDFRENKRILSSKGVRGFEEVNRPSGGPWEQQDWEGFSIGVTYKKESKYSQTRNEDMGFSLFKIKMQNNFIIRYRN